MYKKRKKVYTAKTAVSSSTQDLILIFTDLCEDLSTEHRSFFKKTICVDFLIYS